MIPDGSLGKVRIVVEHLEVIRARARRSARQDDEQAEKTVGEAAFIATVPPGAHALP